MNRVLKIRIYKEGKNECQNFKNISLWVIFLVLECPFMGERQ
ncbi:beta-lactamase domain protein [Helicobacter pylori CPY1962]|nr:beta-lactamase domain protein [Helicobacter pylori CPY1962]